MVFCGKCGTKNLDDNRFCRNCGASLSIDAGEPAVPEPIVKPEPIHQVNDDAGKEDEPKPSMSSMSPSERARVSKERKEEKRRLLGKKPINKKAAFAWTAVALLIVSVCAIILYDEYFVWHEVSASEVPAIDDGSYTYRGTIEGDGKTANCTMKMTVKDNVIVEMLVNGKSIPVDGVNIDGDQTVYEHYSPDWKRGQSSCKTRLFKCMDSEMTFCWNYLINLHTSSDGMTLDLTLDGWSR